MRVLSSEKRRRRGMGCSACRDPTRWRSGHGKGRAAAGHAIVVLRRSDGGLSRPWEDAGQLGGRCALVWRQVGEAQFGVRGDL